jgi:hypothetical protein
VADGYVLDVEDFRTPDKGDAGAVGRSVAQVLRAPA